MNERQKVIGERDNLERLLHDGLRSGEIELAGMPVPSLDYPGKFEAVYLPAAAPRAVAAPRPVRQVRRQVRRRVPLGAKVGIGVSLAMLAGGLTWATYLIVAAVVAHWAAILGLLVVALVLVAWWGAGQAGACPGLHCPGCKCH